MCRRSPERPSCDFFSGYRLTLLIYPVRSALSAYEDLTRVTSRRQGPCGTGSGAGPKELAGWKRSCCLFWSIRKPPLQTMQALHFGLSHRKPTLGFIASYGVQRLQRLDEPEGRQRAWPRVRWRWKRSLEMR